MPNVVVYVPVGAWRALEAQGKEPAAAIREHAAKLWDGERPGAQRQRPKHATEVHPRSPQEPSAERILERLPTPKAGGVWDFGCKDRHLHRAGIVCETCGGSGPR